MSAKSAASILFVCLGNICRSPLAEGVMGQVLAERGLAGTVRLDSAGTGAWHVGSPPDPRSIEVAARHGIDISAQRARKVRPEDFDAFDLVLGMDASNVANLRALSRGRPNIHLFLGHALGRAIDVSDPYYGQGDGFERVYHMIREASEALVPLLAGRTVSEPNKGQASSIR